MSAHKIVETLLVFSRMWELGVALVSTSNRAPDALYEGGIQRVLFLPFIDRLKVRGLFAKLCIYSVPDDAPFPLV